MAARGSIPKMMELAGIDMLSPEAGVPLIRRELTAGGARGELVVAERLGILLSEWDPTGGLDAAACDAAIGAARGPMLGKIAGMGLHSGLVVETTLDPAVQAFLNDHRIDGTPVLPGVMGIEAFAEAAACLLPGWHVDALEDVNFLAPFKFYRDEPRTLTIRALFYSRGDALVADCQLNGVRQLPNQAEPQVTTHFTARVRLTKQPAEAPGGPGPGAPPEPALDSASIYKIYFHGPAYQVLERAWLAERRIVGQMPAALPPHHHPPEQPLLMAPRLIELCLQTAGIWEMDAEGQLGLPLHADRVRLFRAPNPGDGPLFAVVEPGADSQSFDARVVDPSGNCYVQLSGYRTVSLSGLADREPLKALHAAMA
jgi:3-hydroxymyristoyl/3-hydroxydecanoyl-(acyl carrier protein) dehydratase